MITNKEFFSIMRSSKKWSLKRNDHRKVVRLKYNNKCFCPLTFVAKKVNKQYFPIIHWREAAKSLGISYQRARAIIRAADEICSTRSQKNLRKEILRSINLNKGDLHERS